VQLALAEEESVVTHLVQGQEPSILAAAAEEDLTQLIKQVPMADRE
jgi:hypothetical protein